MQKKKNEIERMCNEFRHKGTHVNIICLYQPKKTKVSPYLGT